MQKEKSEIEKHGGEIKPAEPMLRASSSSVQRSADETASESKSVTLGGNVSGMTSEQGAVPVACVGGGAAHAPAGTLPCLNTNNCNEGKNNGSEKLSSGHRKTAFALKLNVQWMIEKHGLERIGFLTLTFARQVVNYKAAQKALHSLMSGVLKLRYCEYIIVMERMTSKRIHYHLLVVMAEDIRNGFNFVAVEHGDYSSASPYLRAEWLFLRKVAPKYGFGRTELLPIKKSAEGVAKYLAKYISKHIGQRLPEDKGARLVRYSKGTNRAGIRFTWNSLGAETWRTKLGAFCRMFRLTSDNHKEFLKAWFGRNWVYVLRPLIESIQLPEFHTEKEFRDSLWSAWVVAANERERRCHRKREPVVPFPKKPFFGGSWIERTLKEDAS